MASLDYMINDADNHYYDVVGNFPPSALRAPLGSAARAKLVRPLAPTTEALL